MSDKSNYDVMVIGSGTAGSNAARAATNAGARVLVVRKPDVWNTCVQEGCMPSKSILAASHLFPPDTFEHAMEIKRMHVERLAGYLDESLHKEFEIIEGTASFTKDGSLSVKSESEEKIVNASKYVIAVGSTPFTPQIEGLETLPKESVLYSRDIAGILDPISRKPKSILVLGGGPIGLELATFLTGMGTKVIFFERKPLLSRMDPEFGEELTKILTEDNVDVVAPGSILKLSYKKDEIIANIDSNGTRKECRAEKILIATGRKPVLDTLNLENIGLKLEDGKLLHDEKTLQTDNPDVYVAGDATGHHQILHYAAAMGRVAGHNAAVGKAEKEIDYEPLNMGIIFTHPPVASMGLSEKEVKDMGIDAVSATVKFSEIGRGILEREKFGLWKLIADKSSGKILGSQIIGSRADDLIHIVSSIMHFGGTAEEIENMLWYHPTYSEFLQSLARKLCEKIGHRNGKISPGT